MIFLFAALFLPSRQKRLTLWKVHPCHELYRLESWSRLRSGGWNHHLTTSRTDTIPPCP